MSTAQTGIPGQSKLTFDEEFNSFSIWSGTSGTWDTSRWYSPNGVTGYHGEEQWYVNPLYAPTASANPFSLVSGALDITAKPADGALQPFIQGEAYTSGFITTYHSFSQTYGYFEMRAQLPAGQGLWPAFWLLPADNTWPPELDVMEVLGNRPNLLYTTVHTVDAGTQQIGPGHNQTQGYTTVADTSAGFHTYGVDWESDFITWYFDDTPVFRTATPADMNKPMYLIANLAVGGDWPGAADASTPFPATLRIDFIHAYSALPVFSPTLVNADAGAGASWCYQPGGSVAFDGSHSVAAAISLTGTTSFVVADGQSERFGGVVSDAAAPAQAGFFDKAGSGALTLAHLNSFSGGIILEAGVLDLASAGAGGSGIIEFAVGSAETLQIEAAALVGLPVIGGFANGDTIRLAGAGLAAGSVFDSRAGTLTLIDSEGQALAVLQFVGDYTGTPFTVTGDGTGGTLVQLADAATLQSGLIVRVSEDAYLGNASFTVSADGQQVGGVYETYASHAAGQYEDVVVSGTLATLPGRISVAFINDLYGGAPGTDRNLYVSQVIANGQSYAGASAQNTGGQDTAAAAVLDSNGAATFAVGSPAPSFSAAPAGALVLTLSEDFYQGDAQFTVQVDGVQQGGIRMVSALHSQGAGQQVVLGGPFPPGPLTVGVTFLNDLYGGSALTDRNLYVAAVSADGVMTQENAALYGNGTASFTVSDGQTYNLGTHDVLTVTASEDAYLGDAQFTISVDGVQQGGATTVTALQASGATQSFAVAGAFGSGPHAVTINFINDAWGGTSSLDRNLYIQSIAFDGKVTAESAAQFGGGARDYSGIGQGVVDVPSTASFTSLGADTIEAGDGVKTIMLNGRSDTVSGGSGSDTIVAGCGTVVINANAALMDVAGGGGAMSFIGGSGAAFITAGTGNFNFTGGSGAATITAGAGTDRFTFIHGNAGGTIAVGNFQPGVDYLDLQGYGPGAVDQALASASRSGATTTLTLPDRIILVTGPSALDRSSFT